MNLADFSIHNSHLDGTFSEQDPHLKRLRNQPLVYRFPLLDHQPRSQPGIYTIGGGRHDGQAVQNNDALLIQERTHKLKNIVGILGINPCFSAAEILENIGRGGDLAGCEEALDNLNEEFARHSEMLKTFAMEEQA
jgi:hypothetical protein